MKLPGIPRDPALPPALDHDRLRREGISRIEALGSSRWTDYNSHDPGITLLEALCFAINDLAYRCAFPVRDLLAPPPGQPVPGPGEGPLFSARTILTCQPVTVLDHRKVVVDVDGVRNAWLLPSDDPGVKAAGLRGVHSVVLELADDPLLGSLNDTTRPWHLAGGPEPLPALEIAFPAWDAWRPSPPVEEGGAAPEQAGARRSLSWAWLGEAAATALGVERAELLEGDVLEVDVRVEVPAGPGHTVSHTVPLRIQLLDAGERSIDTWRKPILDELGRTGPDNPLEAYRRRLRKALSVVAQVSRRLQGHRALCEDFQEPVAARFEEISFCAGVEVAPEENLEEVHARILLAVARLLAPPVRFHTLAELLARDLPAERIFEGPALEHGFLLDEALAASEPPRQVHASDILGEIMDVEGVIAVRSLSMAAHAPDGREVASGERWKIDLLERHLSRLGPERCKLVFYKQDIPYATSTEEVEQKLELLIASEGMLVLTRPTGLALDLAPPAGSWKALDDYRLLQDDLPRVYGVGVEGLPRSASPRRKAQARQMEAYLLLFDQLLSSALAQLTHLRDLFSLDPAVRRTYFGEPLFLAEGLRGRPELRDLFQESFVREVDEGQSPLQRLAEDDDAFVERRNQFLDHLLARFNERFTECADTMELPDRGKARERHQLLDDKIAFLREYPRLSSGRGKGFDASGAEGLWSCDNVSGLELRLCCLLGLRRRDRRHLAGRFTLQAPDGAGAGYHFLRHDAAGNVVLRGLSYPTAEEAAADMNVLESYAARRACYRLDRDDRGEYFELLKSSGRPIARGVQRFQTREEAEGAIAGLVDDLRECEGMHLVEHILLRPASNESAPLEATGDPECEPCPESAAPYSFRATLLFPGWSPRFASPSFRAFVDQVARLEAPAHVLLRICWVPIEQMQQFEAAYLPWLEERARAAPDPAVLAARRRALLETLQALRSMYPEATLHDYREDRVENPVFLDRTQIGSLPDAPDSESE